MPFPNLPVSTDRLTLRPFAEDDFEAYAAYQSLPSVYEFLYSTPLEGDALREKFKRVLEAPFQADGDAFRLAVVRNGDAAVIGQVLLQLASQAALQAEVGYIFNPAFSGKGYATEAVRAMIDLGFSAFGFHRIFARLDTRNAGSVGVVERLGLRREAHLLQNDRFNGVWGDEYIYAVLASEWAGPSQPPV